MKASDFNHLIRNNCMAAITELSQDKPAMAFETVIGILECHKQALLDWRCAHLAQQMRDAAPRIELSK